MISLQNEYEKILAIPFNGISKIINKHTKKLKIYITFIYNNKKI